MRENADQKIPNTETFGVGTEFILCKTTTVTLKINATGSVFRKTLPTFSNSVFCLSKLLVEIKAACHNLSLKNDTA